MISSRRSISKPRPSKPWIGRCRSLSRRKFSMPRLGFKPRTKNKLIKSPRKASQFSRPQENLEKVANKSCWSSRLKNKVLITRGRHLEPNRKTDVTKEESRTRRSRRTMWRYLRRGPAISSCLTSSSPRRSKIGAQMRKDADKLVKQ